MKTWRWRGLTIAFLCVVGIAIGLMGHFYFRYVSQRIYDESTGHLVEVYSQVNNTFGDFLERNWGSLNDWAHHIQLEDDEGASTYISGRQDYWGFSGFYFLAGDGSFLTADGAGGQLALEGARERLFGRRENIMVNETLPAGQTVTIFAIPVEEASYQGFIYSAIAVSYTNADMLQSLNTDAFSGQSRCFVAYTDGRILLSTQSGGSVFGNYISYLRAGSDLDGAALDRLCRDWENGASGVVRCQIGGTGYYIAYLPVGYEDCVLLGVVPESAASASLLEIQRATVEVLIVVFLLVGAVAVLWMIRRIRRQSRKSWLELQYRELLFSTLSTSVDDIFVMLDRETWRVDYVSPNVERLLGISLESAVENIRQVAEGSGDPITYEQLTAIPVHGSRQWDRQHTHKRTGELRWYRETAYLESIQGVRKMIVVMSDRTRERELNRNLQHALDTAKSANEAKSHFLSNMSHDIRTPMNAIMGFSVLLEKDADEPEKVREYVRKISASSQHLLGLINDVLDMSKIESGKTSLNLAPFDLPRLLEELYAILAPQARAKGHTLEIHIQGRPPESLLGDKLRLNQILINLLSNAVKYTPDGGRIDFTVEELPQPSPQYAALRFIVADNGIGMSEEFLEVVFDPFARELNSTTSGIQGTGLGMAITKNLVDLMGGVIQVTSRRGEGTTFTVELSFALPDAMEDENFWRHRGISRILVADDEEEVRRDIRELMRDTGVEISGAADGAEAVEAVAQALDRGEPFQAILLDWQMPGMSGAEAARNIRALTGPQVPIVLLTSYDWSEAEAEARAAGIDAFMPKPFFVSTFRQALENLSAGEGREPEGGGEERPLEGLLFLVAEDNELNAEILAEMLEIEGARHELAVNGQKALEMFRQSPPDYYDMILMDVQMPVMNGYEATRRIRACGHPSAAHIPIVAMTANAFAEDVRNAMDAGMNGHLSKPIDMNAVKALLGRLRRNAGREGAAEKGASSE